MRKKQSILGAVLLGFLGAVILAGGLIRLTTDDRKESSGGSSGSSLPGVSDSSSSTEPVFDPYEGVSGNRTVLYFDIPEDNKTVSFPVGAEVERVVFSDSDKEEFIYTAHQDVSDACTIEYTFETSGAKMIDILGETSVPYRAFYEEKRLTSVTIGEGVTVIGEESFYNCTALQTVDFSSTSLKTIENSAFLFAEGLLSVEIPDSVNSLGKNAFSYCYALKNVKIGSGISSVPYQAFYACSAVEELAIGENVTLIDAQAFSCLKSLKEVVIPDSVKTIGYEAFAYCDHVETLTIGSGVESIAGNAFDSFLPMTTIYCRAEVPPTLDTNVFNGCDKIEEIFVLSETAKTAYQTADGWSAFADKIFVA